MTTKELIEKLQELDPSGELEVIYEEYEYGEQDIFPKKATYWAGRPAEYSQIELQKD